MLRTCLISTRSRAALHFRDFGMLLCLAIATSHSPVFAQSILGSISGTVHDSSGALVPSAKVLLHRTETNTDRTVISDKSGNYEAINMDAGVYDITATAAGFATTVGTGVTLLARQQLQYDITLKVTATNETVTVSGAGAGVINTENAQISAALTPRAVLDLPANYRGAGSTSPVNLVQALPGVQPDSSSYPPTPSTHPQPSLKVFAAGRLAVSSRDHGRWHLCAKPDQQQHSRRRLSLRRSYL